MRVLMSVALNRMDALCSLQDKATERLLRTTQNLGVDVHGSFIQNSPNLATTQMSFNR